MVHREKVILLACGTFNPPHPMHFRMFELARDHLHQSKRYEVVGGIISPTHDSYTKHNIRLEHFTHRCKMIELSLQSSDWIRLSRYETSQPEWTSTLQVLEHHQNYLNGLSKHEPGGAEMPTWMPPSLCTRADKNVTIKLLCGTDFFESMTNAELWPNLDVRSIIRDYGVVVISRTEANLKRAVFNHDLFYECKDNIHAVDNYVMKGVSSTLIRLLLKRGVSMKYILSDDVIGYINEHKLYDTNSSNSTQTSKSPVADVTSNSQKSATQEVHDHICETSEGSMLMLTRKRKATLERTPAKHRG